MRYRILVADDDLSLSDGYKEILEIIFELELILECEIVIANNRDDALRLAQEGGWHIAIVDGNFQKGIVTGDDGRDVTNLLSKDTTFIIGISGAQYQLDAFWQDNGIFLKKPPFLHLFSK
jgi:CheY-like chemotaxis protein